MNKFILNCFFVALLVTSSVTNAFKTEQINDLNLDTKSGIYTVSGSDSFIVFQAANEKSKSSKKTYLYFDWNLIQGESKPDELIDLRMQLFFKRENGGFNPLYRIDFNPSNEGFFLEIPIDFKDSNTPLLRLDVDQCQQCEFSFGGARFTDLANNARLINPTTVKNGGRKLSATSTTELALDSWNSNHIEGDLNQFEINGDDPYFVSGSLDISTDGLAGIYFKLKKPFSETRSDYQLFYTTENNAFNANINSIARVTQNKSEGDVEIVFPLDHLSRETPTDLTLNQVRLDFPLINGEWSIKEVSLIHHQQMSKYEALIPKLLIENKRQRATGKALIKKVLLNMWKDKAFIISYLILLLIVASLFIRRYKD